MALALNQSLTPTKLSSDAPLSPSNYPDKRSMVAAYKRMVLMVLDTPEERAALQKVLKEFHGSYLVEDLMENLKEILNEPRKRQLYLAIRPLIPSRLRPEYNSLIPHVPSFEKKVVHMKQLGSHSLGFAIRGGKEFGCGVYISSVLPSSKAAQCGLKAGDEVVRVNGLTLSQATHEEVVNLLRLKKTLTLSLRVVGMIPEQKSGTNKISWKTVVEDRKKQSSVSKLGSRGPIAKSTRRIQVTVEGDSILGASIKSSSDKESGVIIVEVVPGSAAEDAGLKVGDEIVDVNGHSLINKPHSEAVRLLKSSPSLMLTIHVEESASKGGWYTTSGGNRGRYDPLANPPEDFELKPQDFDIDAELIPSDLDQSTGFVLKAKDEEAARQAIKRARAAQIQRNEKNRFSLLDMEANQDKDAPIMASPAAIGYGPTLAMPTLFGMMPEMPSFSEGESSQLDISLTSALGLSPEGKADRSSAAGGEMPLSIANLFPDTGPDEQERPVRMLQASGQSQEPNRLTHNISGEDLASYQFPVEEDEEEETAEQERPPPPSTAPPPSSQGPPTAPKPQRLPELNRQPSSSALKKSPSDSGAKPRRTPAFKESVEIINLQEQQVEENLGESSSYVHPSNMEFNEEVLMGRRVAFHTIPKDGPIKIAIRGGIDTPLGGQIIISRILEGGAAHRYGNLNVGDEILVCDGVSMIEVTHDEAAQALKRAMDMESGSIDLVVAVNPEADLMGEDEDDTLCDHPPSGRSFDFAKSSHRAHSGFTLRGKDKAAVHSFLPQLPQQQ